MLSVVSIGHGKKEKGERARRDETINNQPKPLSGIGVFESFFKWVVIRSEFENKLNEPHEQNFF